MGDTLKYKGYEGSVEYGQGDHILCGRVLFIDRLVAYHGSSLEQLSTSFQDAVDDYLEDCQRDQTPPSKPSSMTISVCIEPELYKLIVQTAHQRETTLSEYVEGALRDAIKRDHPGKKVGDASK